MEGDLAMQYLGFGIFAVIFIGAVWMLDRSMTSNDRNEGSKHGGGLDDMRGETELYGSGGSSED
jgi:hypothetical protein